MKNSLKVKAKALDARKDKMLYAGLALLAGLAGVLFLSSTVKAEEKVVPKTTEWTPHVQVQEEIKLPFELKSQKFSH